LKDAPGVYSKADFGAAPTNFENRQTFNAGDLKAWAPVDIYSRVRWSFDGGMLEGWSDNGEAEANAEDKTKGLVLTVTGKDPQLIGPETSFPASEYPGLSLKTTSAGAARVYFATSTSPGFDETRALDVTLQGGETIVRLADHAAWTGTITQLRIDPVQAVTFDELRMTTADAVPTVDPAAEDLRGGCGCTTPGHAGPSGSLATLIALALLRRRS